MVQQKPEGKRCHIRLKPEIRPPFCSSECFPAIDLGFSLFKLHQWSLHEWSEFFVRFMSLLVLVSPQKANRKYSDLLYFAELFKKLQKGSKIFRASIILSFCSNELLLGCRCCRHRWNKQYHPIFLSQWNWEQGFFGWLLDLQTDSRTEQLSPKTNIRRRNLQ